MAAEIKQIELTLFSFLKTKNQERLKEQLKLAVDSNIDITCLYSSNGNTLFHEAAYLGLITAAETLIEFCLSTANESPLEKEIHQNLTEEKHSEHRHNKLKTWLNQHT